MFWETTIPPIIIFGVKHENHNNDNNNGYNNDSNNDNNNDRNDDNNNSNNCHGWESSPPPIKYSNRLCQKQLLTNKSNSWPSRGETVLTGEWRMAGFWLLETGSFRLVGLVSFGQQPT